jgi:hypothetical protein
MIAGAGNEFASGLAGIVVILIALAIPRLLNSFNAFY